MIADLMARSFALMPSESENGPFKINADESFARGYFSHATMRKPCCSGGCVST
jgi:hypothetical protein